MEEVKAVHKTIVKKPNTTKKKSDPISSLDKMFSTVDVNNETMRDDGDESSVYSDDDDAKNATA